MPTPQSTGPDEQRPNAPIWLKILVFWHVLAITVWALPIPGQPILEGKAVPGGSDKLLAWNYDNLKMFPPIRAYLFSTGFWQYWDMFSPNPAGVDNWLSAEVVYADGSIKTYHYPRMYDLSIPVKYEKERFRKFNERLDNAGYAYFWPVFGQRVARLMDDPANPPVVIRFQRHFYKIPPIGTPPTYEYTTQQYYEYAVDPEQLQADRGQNSG